MRKAQMKAILRAAAERIVDGRNSYMCPAIGHSFDDPVSMPHILAWFEQMLRENSVSLSGDLDGSFDSPVSFTGSETRVLFLLMLAESL